MTRVETAIEVLIVDLSNALRDAARRADETERLFVAGNRNGAIGSLLAAEADIDRVHHLKACILHLHRTAGNL